MVDLRVVLPPQASIVSVLPVGSDVAEVQVKDTPGLKVPYALSGQGLAGNALTFSVVNETAPPPQQFTGLTIPARPFQLMRHRVTGLTAGQTYRFRLRFLYNNTDTLTVERAYIHRPPANWTRLAHLPANFGEFMGTPTAMDLERQGNLLSLFRYVDASTMQTLQYFRTQDLWFIDPSPPPMPAPRPGMIQFILYFQNIDSYRFWGLGYQVSDRFPDKFVYMRDMYLLTPPPYNRLNVIQPSYLGQPGEPAFFHTIDRAFFLTQNGSPALFEVNSIGGQHPRQPLPEPPGTLATFTIDSVGYVVNQVGSQQPRLWAYDTRTDTWSRRADFPGPIRSRGVGFSIARKGYFGLGTTPVADRGFRDVWQYDPATDRWQYVTDYPGQGNRFLSILSLPQRVYIGLGYETQAVPGNPATTRQTGCTDWWEFKP